MASGPLSLCANRLSLGRGRRASAELEKTRAYIIDQLRSFGLNVTTDEFHATTPVGERKMANIIAELPGNRTTS